MDIKPVKNKRDYNKALERVDKLMDSRKGTPEFDELEILSILVERYEDEHTPIDYPDPIEAIHFYMEQNDLRPRDLVSYIGSRSKVSEVLNKKRPLSIKMIRSLTKYLKIPASILINEYSLDETA